MFGFKIGERIQITDVTQILQGSDVFEDGDITTVESITDFHGTPLLLVKPTIDVGDPDYLFPLSISNEGGIERLDVEPDYGGHTAGDIVVVRNLEEHPFAGDYLKDGDLTVIKRLDQFMGMPVVYVEHTEVPEGVENPEDDDNILEGVAFSGLDITKMLKKTEAVSSE